MGKRIIQQRRGRGTLTYRVRKKAFKYRIKYPISEGKAKVLKLINSAGHSCPLAKIIIGKEIFYNPASKNLFEGQEIEIKTKNIEKGNILLLKNIPIGTELYNIESRPGDGGKLVRSGGNSAILTKKQKNKVALMMPSKKEIWIDEKCRATIGRIAGEGRLEKPVFKAGKKYYIKKAKSKLWPRTSAVKMNVVDHPFGSGRGKRIAHGQKGKIPKRNAPPGAKVGTLSPRRTGRRKR
ncbi:MAG: 50S ribosomal protein L2 [Nanoarchaeota archaeon]|nr:50S ribosomal protein L2 [Nanoarchaeota archaeon]